MDGSQDGWKPGWMEAWMDRWRPRWMAVNQHSRGCALSSVNRFCVTAMTQLCPLCIGHRTLPTAISPHTLPHVAL